MSNTQKAPEPAEPAPIVEDCGIGYCVSCLNRYIEGEMAEHPGYAIALVPVPGLPFPLGACYRCVKILIKGGSNGHRKLWTGS